MYEPQLCYEKATCPHCNKDIYVRYQKKPQLQILGLVDTTGVITNTKGNPDIESIYDFWNSQHIIVHRNMTSDISKAIRAGLKDYSDTEILQAIQNYAEIQQGNQYWFSYIWTLSDFLKRGISKFLDLEIDKKNYLRANGLKANKLNVEDPDKFIKGKYGHIVRR